MPALSRSSLDLFLKRFQAMNADAKPKWGSMTAPQMLRHLRRFVEISLGEYKVPDRSLLISRLLGEWTLSVLMWRWPKGMPNGDPKVYHPVSGEFGEEIAALKEALNRFVAALELTPERGEVSELLGPLSLRRWSRLHGRHIDHHLTQFGV